MITEITDPIESGRTRSNATLFVRRTSSEIPLRISGAPLPRLRGDGQPVETLALVMIDDPVRQLASAEPALRANFGLTKAEARLAANVASGMSVVEAAQRQGVSYNTARTQMRMVYEKMGIHMQSELAAIVSGMRSL